MLVTPNCNVKPTPATARIDAVTRPNPIAGINVLTIGAPLAGTCRSMAERRDLRSRYRADQHDLAVHVPGRLERAGGVVPLVEHDRPAGADVLNLLAGLKGCLAGSEGVDDRFARSWLRDLGNEFIEDGWAGAFGGDHRQRHYVDAVVVRH